MYLSRHINILMKPIGLNVACIGLHFISSFFETVNCRHGNGLYESYFILIEALHI